MTMGNKLLKWWYITCTIVVAVAVLIMAACVCTHVRTHYDQLLAIAGYARYAIYSTLAAAILPLLVIMIARVVNADNPPVSSIGAHLPQRPDRKQK